VVAARDGAVELDRTVFYPLGGGQPGDTGRVGEWRVLDTRKGNAPDSVVHVLEPGARIAQGMTVPISLDWERRLRHMRFHTALHLLCAVVKAPVTGGRMAEDKAHLDFDIEMERLVKEEIEAGLNALVAAGHAVRPQWITDAELEARPDLVRTMSVAPPPLAVARIRSEGKRNKRVTLVLA
jgi:misacylated tRNA(Ala) deacylase